MNRELLTAENYSQGFLVDEELMAGVSEAKGDQPTGFTAFVLRQTTGEMLGSSRFSTLKEALGAINQIPREWAFDSTHGCGNGNCGAAGQGKCPAGKCGALAKQVAKNEATSPNS